MQTDGPSAASSALSDNTSSGAASTSSRPPFPRDPSSSGVRPKGILKHAGGSTGQDGGAAAEDDAQTVVEGQGAAPSLRWDEVNLNLNEVNRDSTMKITEPKTPWVGAEPRSEGTLRAHRLTFRLPCRFNQIRPLQCRNGRGDGPRQDPRL